MKRRLNLISLLETEFTKFYRETIPLGPAIARLSPILFLSFPTPYAGPIISTIFSYFARNGTNLLKKVYKQTEEFFTGSDGEEVLRVLSLPQHIDDSLHLETLVPFMKNAVKNDEDKKKICQFILFSLQRNLINFNNNTYWDLVKEFDQDDFANLYQPSKDNIIKKELKRREEITVVLYKETAERIKAIKVEEALEAEKALLAEIEEEKKPKSKKKKGGYTRKSRRS